MALTGSEHRRRTWAKSQSPDLNVDGVRGAAGLFRQVGLLAAMLAHMLYHLVWLPFDLHFARQA